MNGIRARKLRSYITFHVPPQHRAQANKSFRAWWKMLSSGHRGLATRRMRTDSLPVSPSMADRFMHPGAPPPKKRRVRK